MPEQFLHGVEIIEINDGPRPIKTVKSSVIGLVGTAPKGPINTPTLILGSRQEAVRIFGPPTEGFTIPSALDAIFDQTGAMVVVINVADPANSALIKQVEDDSKYFDVDDEIKTGHANITGVIVKTSLDNTVLVENTDYSVDYGQGIIRNLGAIDWQNPVLVSYSYMGTGGDMTGYVVGGVDATTSTYKGVHALLAAQSEVKVQPRILIAPGFTHTRPEGNANPVVAELMGIAERLRAVVIADCPNISETEAIDYREDWGSARLYCVYPWLKTYNPDSNTIEHEPASARVAGMIAKSDNERGFWWSPSNTFVNGIVGISKPIDFVLGDTNCKANFLNENQVATFIQEDGFRLWGNRSASADPKWVFLSVRRTADMINDSLMRAHLWAVDRNITKTYVEDVCEGVNNYLRHLKAIGAILGGKCWADPALNTPDQIEAGKITFDFDFTPPYPAEHITFRSRMINGYLTEIFK